jgi:hypothetical protein
MVVIIIIVIVIVIIIIIIITLPVDTKITTTTSTIMITLPPNLCSTPPRGSRYQTNAIRISGNSNSFTVVIILTLLSRGLRIRKKRGLAVCVWCRILTLTLMTLRRRPGRFERLVRALQRRQPRRAVGPCQLSTGRIMRSLSSRSSRLCLHSLATAAGLLSLIALPAAWVGADRADIVYVCVCVCVHVRMRSGCVYLNRWELGNEPDLYPNWNVSVCANLPNLLLFQVLINRIGLSDPHGR